MKKTAQTKLIVSLSLFLNLFLGICFLGFAQSTHAQSALGLSAIPPRIEITAKPGEAFNKVIKIRNESTVDKYVSTKMVDFIVTDSKGTPVRISGIKDNRWTASNWLNVSPNKVQKIKPGETVALNLLGVVPDNATPGGHYAMVLHTPGNEAVISQNSSAIETNVGTLVYITVPGKINQDARVDKFTAPKFSEYGPIDFQTLITNLSDIHIKPQGQIKITNIFGLKTKTLVFNEKDYNIFPFTVREFENQLKSKWLFGRYKAHLEAAYGTAGGLVSSTLYFWVIPWRLLILLAAAILINILLIALFRKPKNTKQDKTIDKLEKELDKLKNKYKDLK